MDHLPYYYPFNLQQVILCMKCNSLVSKAYSNVDSVHADWKKNAAAALLIDGTISLPESK